MNRLAAVVHINTLFPNKDKQRCILKTKTKNHDLELKSKNAHIRKQSRQTAPSSFHFDNFGWPWLFCIHLTQYQTTETEMQTLHPERGSAFDICTLYAQQQWSTKHVGWHSRTSLGIALQCPNYPARAADCGCEKHGANTSDESGKSNTCTNHIETTRNFLQKKGAEKEVGTDENSFTHSLAPANGPWNAVWSTNTISLKSHSPLSFRSCD